MDRLVSEHTGDNLKHFRAALPLAHARLGSLRRHRLYADRADTTHDTRPLTTPTPPVKPPVDSEDALELIKSIPYETEFSNRVVGIVRNTGNQNMQFLRITANSFDSSAQLVATDFTYTDLDTVQLGEEAVFSFYLSDAISNLDNYEISASRSLTDDSAIRLDVTQATLQDSSIFQELIWSDRKQRFGNTSLCPSGLRLL